MQKTYSSSRQRRPGAPRPTGAKSSFGQRSKPNTSGKSYHSASRSRGRSRGASAIDHRRFINADVAAPIDEAPYRPAHAFADFALNDQTKRTLEFLQFAQPSPIQDQCIPLALGGADVIGLASTGTGKTAAFLLPVIEKIATDGTLVSALVIAPTRELAQQIEREFVRFAAGQKLYTALLVGGAPIGRQIQQVKRGPHIVIGTPGRVKDLIDRKLLRLGNISTFVLDEADRMCDMGFSKDIRFIAAELPVTRQTLCFSATMTPAVQTIVEEFMHQPVTASVVKKQTSAHIRQDVIRARGMEEKIEKLVALLSEDAVEKTIVFGETKYGVQRLADRITAAKIPATAIHGNKSQSQRERALRQFKSGDVNVLVATDVAARGLDIPDVTHVINFDAPKVYDDYIHRIGRTGRAGKTGTAWTFV